MKKTGIILLFLMPFVCLFGQTTLNNLWFPAPNNNFLNAAGGATGVGVDLYTGTAQVNIPITTLASKELTIPVSLSYTGGRGIRVQEYATSVGLGWQLAAAGSISRVVRGFPDEFSNGYLGTGQWGKKIKQRLADGVFLSAVDEKAITGWEGENYNGISADGEPDLYYIKTPFFSAQFTFNENGVPVFSNEAGVKITSYNFFNTSSYESSTFVVTDPSGNTYNFGLYKDKTITTLYGSTYTFTTTWYLSNIITFNSKDNVSFNYITSANNDILTRYQRTRDYAFGCQNDNSDPIPNTIVQPKLLSGIVCQNGQIDFAYAFDRRDVTNAARLTSITLKAQSAMGTTTVKTFAFNHSYFGDPSTDVYLLRLKLDKITVTGSAAATATAITYRQFFYEIGQNLPARNSQSFDYWGYYKSFAGLPVTDPMTDPTIRTPNVTNTQANILTGILELGDAMWGIAYELNTYKNSSNTNVDVGGLRVKKISRSLYGSGQTQQATYQYNDDAGKSTGQILSESYKNLAIDWFNSSCGWLAVKVLSEVPVNMYDLNGTFIGYSAVKTIFPNGGYMVSNFQNFSDFNDGFSTLINCEGKTMPLLTSSISFAYKRGLPKSTATYNSSNQKITEELYTYSALTVPVAKSGWAYRPFSTARSCNISTSGRSIYSDLSSGYYTNIENYRLASTTSKIYDQVTPANYVQSITNYTYCNNKRTVKSITTRDSKNNLAEKIIYHAHDTGIPMVTTEEQTVLTAMQALNNLDAVVHEKSDKNGAVTQVHNTYGYAFPGSSKPLLTSTSAYKASTLLTTQHIIYDAEYVNMVSGNTALSGSTTEGKSSSVLYGYNNAYPVAMVSNAAAFYSKYQSTSGFGNTFSTSASYTFTVDYAGTIGWTVYPATSLSSNASVSYTLSGPSNRSGSGTISAPSGYYSVSHPNMPIGTYTVAITVSGPSGVNYYVTSTYPKYAYALEKEYFFEGFEENGSATSGNAHTGNKYWSAGSFAVPYTPSGSRNYVMQWWVWTSGKWLFKEADYTGPTTISGIVDDIRIFPKDAQMSTFTYNPQLGKTGEIDPSGRTATYEFDGLGRVSIVRDNDKNIVSRTCYNYAGNTENCPAATVYSSVAKSQAFTRNNCSSGQTGSTATYTVVAGAYTSAISQADADQQALNDITLNGQTYANTSGTCIQTFYNVAKSGSFTRNNCGSGSTGSAVTYTVAAGVYSSTISQSDADQKAQNDVNNNGQAYANANGTCTAPSCSFAMASGYSSPTNGINSSSGSASFYLVFYSTSATMYTNSSYLITTINGGCRPSAQRIVNVTTGGRTWQLTINTNGQVYAKITSGSNVNSGTTITFNSVSYTL